MIGRWDGHVVSGKQISLVHVSLELFALTRVFLDVEVVIVHESLQLIFFANRTPSWHSMDIRNQ